MDFEKLVIQIADQLDLNFWEKWKTDTSIFPDTEEGWQLQLFVIQISLATIVSKYLLGFKARRRRDELEALIKDFRTIEISLRDIE